MMTKRRIGREQSEIFMLLDAIKADHPRRKHAAEELMREAGIDGTFDLTLEPAKSVRELPTFDRNVWRPVSPMFDARFGHSGSWRLGLEIWLDCEQMGRYLRKADVREYHLALRKHSESSAPMLFPDHQLGLFAATEELSEDLTYLVWPSEALEPEIWEYDGYEFHKAENLKDYLKWRLERP